MVRTGSNSKHSCAIVVTPSSVPRYVRKAWIGCIQMCEGVAGRACVEKCNHSISIRERKRLRSRFLGIEITLTSFRVRFFSQGTHLDWWIRSGGAKRILLQSARSRETTPRSAPRSAATLRDKEHPSFSLLMRIVGFNFPGSQANLAKTTAASGLHRGSVIQH